MHEAIEQWMEVADLEVTTRERYEDLIRLYILPGWVRVFTRHRGALH